MATNPTPPNTTPTTSSNLLSILAGINGEIQLAVTIAGVVIPIGKWLVNEFRQITAPGTITYQLLLQQDSQAIENIGQLAVSDLTAINAELTRLGLPTLTIPPAPKAPAPPGPPVSTGPAPASK
jgi:hypothetical protein